MTEPAPRTAWARRAATPLRPSDLAAARAAGRLRRRPVCEDEDSADLSGVSGTPTFFVNGMRHPGGYDLDALTTAVRTARVRASIANKMA